ncbi:MAG: class I SAM-dependent methyltransferase [Myxococcaceae bacterium]|nr:class I SAM-dependent methyltransferase [Myxococcaceae bacterium]
MAAEDLERFKNLTYEGFRALAKDPSLTANEKIGFPESYRGGKERAIFEDLLAKLPALSRPGATVVDVGPGCAPLAFTLIEHCQRLGQTLVLIDSPEMLAQLPDGPKLEKRPGLFPRELQPYLSAAAGTVDVVLSYSVLHYVFPDGSVPAFLDAALTLLKPQGEVLIGDIPNVSMRRRFFASETGVAFHRQFTKTDTRPEVHFNVLEPGAIDDGALIGMMLRARAAGFDAWLVPQRADLPMANRREDLLIRRP